LKGFNHADILVKFQSFVDTHKKKYPELESLTVLSQLKDIPFSEELAQLLQKMIENGLMSASLVSLDNKLISSTPINPAMKFMQAKNFLPDASDVDASEIEDIEQETNQYNQFSFTVILEEYPTLMTMFLDHVNLMADEFIKEMNGANLDVKINKPHSLVISTRSRVPGESEPEWRRKFPKKYLYGFLANYHTRTIEHDSEKTEQLINEIANFSRRQTNAKVVFYMDIYKRCARLTALVDDFSVLMMNLPDNMINFVNSGSVDTSSDIIRLSQNQVKHF
jgi:hypothetical protein